VPISDGRTGDLVFFNIGARKLSHVGIYLGQDEFIHVSISDGVIISSLSEDYYKNHFTGLRRISFEQVASSRR
jgi:cell wall-associated NlpC family hydrolase